MNSKLTTRFKMLLSKVIPNSERLRFLVWLPKLHEFHREYGHKGLVFESRGELYNQINASINNEAISYLEFGVFKGDSIKHWSKLNTNINSSFSGFDTFSGLPEDWDNFTGGLKKGTFDTKGELPNIEDSRVSFHKGMFQETLPAFIEDNNFEKRLIINIDADLYSSTLYVLTMLQSKIVKGTIIIFDEFSSIMHEFRAFEDYCGAYRINFEVIASTISSNKYYAHVAVIIL